MNTIAKIHESKAPKAVSLSWQLFRALAHLVFHFDEEQGSLQPLADLPDGDARLVSFLFDVNEVGVLDDFIGERICELMWFNKLILMRTAAWLNTAEPTLVVFVARTTGPKIGLRCHHTGREVGQFFDLDEGAWAIRGASI